MRTTLSCLLATLPLLASCDSSCPDKLRQLELPGANAGCLVIHNNRLLVVQDHDDRLSIPGGSSEVGENAACTAWRETMEETSLQAIPGKVAQRWPNGFYMFRCELLSDPATLGVQHPREIKQVLWLQGEEFNRYSWRFPGQRDWLVDWLKLENGKAK